MIDEGVVVCQILGLRFTREEVYAAKDVLDSDGYKVLSQLMSRRRALDVDELIGNPSITDVQLRETRGSLRMLREIQGFDELIKQGITECEAQA
jgi:hypothetical protein